MISSYFQAPAAWAVASGSLSWGRPSLVSGTPVLRSSARRLCPGASGRRGFEKVHASVGAFVYHRSHQSQVRRCLGSTASAGSFGFSVSEPVAPVSTARIPPVLLRALLPRCRCDCQSGGGGGGTSGRPSVALGLLLLGRAERSALASAQGQQGGGGEPGSTTSSGYGRVHPTSPRDGGRDAGCPVGARSRL